MYTKRIFRGLNEVWYYRRINDRYYVKVSYSPNSKVYKWGIKITPRIEGEIPIEKVEFDKAFSRAATFLKTATL